MLGFSCCGVVRTLVSLGLGLSVAGAAGEAAANSVTLPFTVEFDEGLTGDFGTVLIEELSGGTLAFTIELSPELGSEADLHEFYANLGDLDVDLVLSDSRCREQGDSGFGSCETDFDVEQDDPSNRAGTHWDFEVNFGDGDSSEGNGDLEAASFILAAFEDDDGGVPVPLTIAHLLAETSETSDGIEAVFAAHIQSTDLTDDHSATVSLIPEPGTAGLLGLGLAGFAFAGRRRA